MRVLFASSEIYPLAKTGGLGDVAGSLPQALHGKGADIRLLMPAYPGAAARAAAKPVARLDSPFGRGGVSILEGTLPGSDLTVWLVDNPALFDRAGGPYQDAAGRDWQDNDIRFALLGWVAAMLCQSDSPLGWVPQILHTHDWQTGLAPAYLRAWGGPRPGLVFTIHNLAYQGSFASDLVPQLGFPWSFYTMEGFEFWGHLSYLKAGLVYSDKITTVSPTYAREIQTAAYGFGMQGLLAHRAADLSGILNGTDYGVWDPRQDRQIAQPYGPAGVARGKAANKAALQAQLGLDRNPAAPLLVVVSRLSDQKGMDLLLAIMPALLAEGVQLALVGSGEHWLEDSFRKLGESHPGQVAVHIGYSEDLAHRLQAGGDMLVMPSRYEPCGLTQMYALRYGTIPVVHRTGGLADTVVDANQKTLEAGTATGFVFDQASASHLQWCIERALTLFRQPQRWQRIVAEAMRQDFGWGQAAERYLDLYRSLCPKGSVGKAKKRAQV